ncbi:hypothetical protein ACOMHN_014102 [Nucella lapillus]
MILAMLGVCFAKYVKIQKKSFKFTGTYPQAYRNSSVVDNFFGKVVHDPYRWLEDPNSKETKDFVTAQNTISKAYIDGCPAKDKIKLNVVYVKDSLNSTPSVFLDPNKLSADGTTALSIVSFSPDGSLFAYGVSVGGSDWSTVKVKSTSSGQDLTDTVNYLKFSSVSWTHDNKGFFYSRFPKSKTGADGSNTASNVNHTVYYHRMGTNQSDDVLAYSSPNHPQRILQTGVSDDGRYLVIYSSIAVNSNALYVADLQTWQNGQNGPLQPVPFSERFQDSNLYISNEGPEFIIQTSTDAPLNKLVKINFNKPQAEHWVNLVPENPKIGTLYGAVVANDKLVIYYVSDAKFEVFIHNRQTGVQEKKVDLDLGSLFCLAGKVNDSEVFYGFKSFLTPGTVYRLDMTNYKSTVFTENLVSGFNRDDFVIKQEFFNSKDGTRVPMFIVHRKNLQRTGKHPVLMYGYGGYGYSLTPYFRASTTVFLQHMEGIYVLVNIRGGGEYGVEWHKNGSLGNKQNGLDDFQAAAEYLITQNYTNSKKLAIEGSSNGGLLVGACLNQRPDLFASGIIAVGTLDMLRYHLFTIGHAWITEYGSVDIKDEFLWLYGYSPLHNIPSKPKGGQYPSTLLLTADKDDRVVPLHSYKFIATLQYKIGNNPQQTNPLIIRVDTNTGHGAGKPVSKQIEESTDIYSFLYRTLELSWSK